MSAGYISITQWATDETTMADISLLVSQ